jgi:hypothetical protein
MRTRARHVMVALLAIAGGSALAAQPEPTPAHAATCVAALKTRAEPLAQRVRGGDAVAKAQLLPIVTSSFAFIGSVYKQGVRNAEADELLRQAEKAQAQMPPADLARTQDACHAEGQQLLAQANFLEREFVTRAAKRRVERLQPATG